MPDKNLRFIIDRFGDLVVFLSVFDAALIFIPNEKRWGKHRFSPSRMEGAATYESGNDFDNITYEKAKEIFMDCPPDKWLPYDTEDFFDWWKRITTESEKEQIRNQKIHLSIRDLKVIGKDCDESTTTYECPCGKGKVFYTNEHPGFDDWYISLSCDDCEKKYYV